MTKLFQSQTSNLKKLNNLFIELTAKNCNLRCKNCYIDFPISKNVKDFIPDDLIKETLMQTRNENIECIYLTGAEPMTHPDFNGILRMCLKRTNVCICTNGSFINEKKARFLKRVEDESDYEIIFQLGIAHYDEIKNDDIRGRGTYRQTVHALKSLVKYGFNPILCVTNFYKEEYPQLIDGFKAVCEKIAFPANENNFKINIPYEKNNNLEFLSTAWQSLDCEYGRILTTKGIYTCPFLANDHRGRCGSNFEDFAKHTPLETDFCATCIKNQKSMFTINFQNFG